MKKKIFLTIQVFFVRILATAGFAAIPADGDNLYVFTKGAAKSVVYSLENLHKMTFGDEAMSLWSKKGKLADYAYARLDILTFREGMKPTGIVQTLASDKGIRVSYDRGSQVLSVESEEPINTVIVCDMQGRTVANENAKAQPIRLSLAGLPHGVYVVRTTGASRNSVKIIK